MTSAETRVDTARGSDVTAISCTVIVGPPPGTENMTELRGFARVRLMWRGGNEVLAFVDSVDPPFKAVRGCRPGDFLGRCDLGRLRKGDRALDQFFGCARTFARDPWNHELMQPSSETP